MLNARWSDDDNAKFRALWKNPNLSLADIAQQLGKTTSSVAKRRFRMKLPPRGPEFAAAVRWNAPRTAFAKPQNKPVKAVQPVRLGQLPLPQGCQPVSLFDRSETGCCFIVDRKDNQHLYCNMEGKKKGDSHYCDYHNAVRFEVMG